MHLVWTNPLHFHGLGTDRRGCSSDGKGPGPLVANRPNMSQQRPLAGMKADSILGYINRSVVSRPRGVIIAFYTAFNKPHLESCI